jgi:hypothetical protein
MKYILYGGILFMFFGPGCKAPEKKITLPDLRPHFQDMLNSKDSTLNLDSFYFIRLDTMNEKSALIHQRFPFYNILERINGQLQKQDTVRLNGVPSANTIQNIEYLNDEKTYVTKQIDSISRLIDVADSLTPIGYRAFYKVTIQKRNQFVVSDTIPYAISLKMTVSDWDRNLEKNIDSLSVGKHLRTRRNE